MAATATIPVPSLGHDGLPPSPSLKKPLVSQSLKTNLSYLINGSTKTGLKPTSLQTRTTLRTVRYVAKFIFWRLLRYFKYAAIAAGTTALAGSVIGSALPWLAAIAVPSVPVAAAIGLTTATIKFTWRHRGNHFRQGWIVGGEGRDARKDERMDVEETEKEFEKPVVNQRAERAWGYQ